MAPRRKRECPGPDSLARLDRLATAMDSAFVVPGTRIRVGLDPIIGLVPGIGDTLAVAVSGYIYSFAKAAGVPWPTRMRMLWYIFVDWLIGLIPLAGDIFDVGFKANSRNTRIIRAHAQRPDRLSPGGSGRDDQGSRGSPTSEVDG